MSRISVVSLLTVLSLSACSGTSGNTTTNVTSSTANAVSIDAMTSVPVVNGSATKGTLYIHNYGNKPVTGLSFGLKNATTSSKLKSALNALGINLSNSVIDKQGFYLNNPELCTTLAAGASCAINFTTPALAVGDRGNSLVTLNYKENGRDYNTNQIVNYQYTSLSALSGVNFTGGLTVSGAQGTISHVVGYLFGGGTSGSKYSNVNVTSTSPTTVISNGFINGQEVAAGQVIAVEFAVALQNDKRSFVNVIPTWGSSSFNKVALSNTVNSGAALTLTLTPAQNTVNLLFGNIPVLAAPTASAAVINVTNNGNSDSGGGLTVETDNSDLTVTNNCSSTNLQANAANSCAVSFSVAGYTPGNATVTFKQNGIDVGTQSVIWANNTPVPAVYIQPNTNTISFGKGQSTPSNSTVFTLSNIGKAPLNNASYTLTNDTSLASWVQESSTCGSSLAPQSVCAISGHFAGIDDGDGKLYYKVNGSYNSVSYSFVSLPLSYEVTSAPSLVITPLSVNMTLLANGSESIVQPFTVTNAGTDTAIGTSTVLSVNGGTVVPQIVANSCGSNINTGESCNITVTYGPASDSLSVNESGVAGLNISYHGGTPDTPRVASNSFNYKLVGNDSTVTVGTPSSINLSGSGTEANPFSGNPKLNPMQISLTYTNPSVNYPLSSFNLNTNSLPYGVAVDSASTCPTGSTVANIESGTNNSCTLVLNLDRSLLSNAASGGSVVLDFITPTATWTTPLGFYNSVGSQVYVNYLQPTVAFELSDNNSNFESTTLMMTAANQNMATSLNVKVSGVKNWLESTPTNLSSNCSLDSSDNSVSCNLLNTASGSVSYIMPNYLQTGESANIPLMFSVANGEYAYLNPSYTFIKYRNQIPAFTNLHNGCTRDNTSGLIWMTDGNLLGMGKWGLSTTSGTVQYIVTQMNTNSAAAGYNLCGYTDWRLPSKAEFQGLIDDAKLAGAPDNYDGIYDWLNNNGFKLVQPDYWASTNSSGVTNKADKVGLAGLGYISSATTGNNLASTWAVRGQAVAP